MPVIDFHTHTLLSDGVLCVAEQARRARVAGYRYLGLADHADHASLADIVSRARNGAAALNGYMGDMLVLPGVEITHVPPLLIADLVKIARDLGASHVVVHGESLVEPVEPGTNLAAIKAGADILAHPGLLTEQEVALAAEKGVYLELSARGGHCLANGRTASMALNYGAKLLINSDAHSPGDFLSEGKQKNVALGAGLSEEQFAKIMDEAADLATLFHRRFLDAK